MENRKIQIEINHYPQGMNQLCCAVTLRGGYAVRDYILDGKTHFASNYAFFNVLFNYYLLGDEIGDMHFDVQRASSSISFSRKPEELIPGLNRIFRVLFSREYDQERFEKAKNNTKEKFAARYKSGDFRARYKGYEFTELNKRFTLTQLTRDITDITFEQFVQSAKMLLVPDNLCVYICGRTDGLDYSQISAGDLENLPGHTLRIAGVGFDPYLRQDSHVTGLAREDHNLILQTFDFLNPDVTNFTKLLIVEMFGQLLPAREKDIWVDSLDASIMFSTEHLRGYKELLQFSNEKTYETARKGLLTQYTAMLENRAEHFAIKAAGLMTVGVYVDQYINFIAGCGFEEFREICEKADFKITEAQVVLRKE